MSEAAYEEITQGGDAPRRIDTGTDELLCQVQERVATIVLNRPHKKNSLSDLLTPALREVLLVVEADPDVGAVMITGTGDAFCSGGDVSGMGGGAGDAKLMEVYYFCPGLTI